jgi:hypothetical protein
MAVGTYTLPICDKCKLPWLPVGWTQDSDPRGPEGKDLRCGKCKSHSGRHKENAWGGWDGEFAAKVRETSVEIAVTPFDATGGTQDTPVRRCRHRMVNCPLCKPEAA